MTLIDLTQKQEATGGLIAKVVPDCVHLHTWAGDLELTAKLTPLQASNLAKAIQSRCATFAVSGHVKKFQLSPTL